ncbi:6618_t:CDS:2 [Paraglomus brasilianum]|uniref:6618_t:CDS:1 n=1 Tax=Paraglomus brasilianum TaxID=144538 RepID=A0A9N8W365_9GLOM|nr:6618_t:CDS:2 [Paraglomus brasilianum]
MLSDAITAKLSKERGERINVTGINHKPKTSPLPKATEKNSAIVADL